MFPYFHRRTRPSILASSEFVKLKTSSSTDKFRDTLVSQLAALSGSLFTDGEPIAPGYLMQAVDSWAEVLAKTQKGDRSYHARSASPNNRGLDRGKIRQNGRKAGFSWIEFLTNSVLVVAGMALSLTQTMRPGSS
ncbi:hypothetical protein BDV40DRAFT_296831 [Aspergillus tamarii]|uniref:Uncharacterized protein n=1 Tax=Aspergillus tamarii TaxID=41984 RepID=A0A5N6V4T4_ASPTM|nr:hypothetical protein BDV40DRAFT_296831 [Aspergillus tamarii]